MDQLIALYKRFWEQWSDFQGKTTVTPFWLTVLAHFIVIIILTIVQFIFSYVPLLGDLINALSLLYLAASIVPLLAIGARRLNDTKRNPLLLLLWLIPVVGWIILVVFWVQESKA